VQPISLDDRACTARQPGATVAVDPGFVRPHAQPLDRALHGEQRRLQDVQAVDFLDARDPDRESARMLPDQIGELFTREALRSFESLSPAIGLSASSTTAAA
jgi:hypothetical protein